MKFTCNIIFLFPFFFESSSRVLKIKVIVLQSFRSFLQVLTKILCKKLKERVSYRKYAKKIISLLVLITGFIEKLAIHRVVNHLCSKHKISQFKASVRDVTTHGPNQKVKIISDVMFIFLRSLKRKDGFHMFCFEYNKYLLFSYILLNQTSSHVFFVLFFSSNTKGNILIIFVKKILN